MEGLAEQHGVMAGLLRRMVYGGCNNTSRTGTYLPYEPDFWMDWCDACDVCEARAVLDRFGIEYRDDIALA